MVRISLDLHNYDGGRGWLAKMFYHFLEIDNYLKNEVHRPRFRQWFCFGQWIMLLMVYLKSVWDHQSPIDCVRGSRSTARVANIIYYLSEFKHNLSYFLDNTTMRWFWDRILLSYFLIRNAIVFVSQNYVHGYVREQALTRVWLFMNYFPAHDP